MGGEKPILDEEELGSTVQLLYDAFALVESVGGSLSPYVPTQDYVASVLTQLAAAFAERRPRGGRPALYYEPGCGAGKVASGAAARGLHSICLELDEYLAREAQERARRNPLLDVVVGDLSVFRPRRVDVVYAYLLPRAVRRVLEALEGLHAPVVSLDYPAEGDRGVLSAAKLDVLGRSVFVYES